MIPNKKIKKHIEESWVLVELYRWQHGKLPTPMDEKELDYSKALVKMAEAIEKKDKDNFPTPYAIAEVLKWCSEKIKK